MPTRDIELPDGRVVRVDDVGDPAGRPLLFLHGTPSCRLARHPDDLIAAGLGVRLLAVDRPGLGGSSPDPDTTAVRFAADLAPVLDRLGVDRCGLLAWSAGSLWALAAGATPAMADRIERLTIVAGLVPFDAFADPALREAAGPGRAPFIDTVEELGPVEAAQLLAPIMVPHPCPPDVAREHLTATEPDWPDLSPDAQDRMVAGLVEAVRTGLDGVVSELAVAARPLGVDVASVSAPARLVYGARDTTCPPAFGQWLADRLPDVTFEVVPDAGHLVAWSRWQSLLGT